MSNKELTELVEVEAHPPKLSVNFEAMKEALTAEVAKYGDVVVTEDTISEARDAAKQINATRKAIDQVRKERRREAMAPIEKFDADMKALTGICDDARSKITSQIEQFDQQRLQDCERMVHEAMAAAWDEKDVVVDYRRSRVDDLVKLGNLTNKGNLTKSAKDTITARASEDRALQDRVKMRLLELENRSYRAGLSAPLTQDHVHQWLESDDETYEKQLQRILDAEIQREEQAEARRRKQWERERAQEEEARRRREEAERAASEGAPESADDVGAEPPETEHQQCVTAQGSETVGVDPAVPGGDRTDSFPPAKGGTPSESPSRQQVSVYCTFDTAVPPTVTDQQIEAELRRKLQAAGIKSLSSVQIRRHREEAA